MPLETIIGFIGSAASTLIGLGVSWGIVKNRMENQDDEIKDMREELKRHADRYVTKEHFVATTEPLKEGMREIQKDIKRILVILSSNKHGFN